MNAVDTTSLTIAYYESNAAAFTADTVQADMSAALGAFLALIPSGGRVLDWGCGSGRDAKAMLDAGYDVIPVDASPAMCACTESLIGRRPRCEGFLQLADEREFDGIWACASLLHLPPADLSHAFELAARALKDGGVLYASFKLGNAAEMRDGRWFTDLDEDSLVRIVSPVLEVERVWLSDDVRPGRKEQRWVNVLARTASPR